MSTTRDLAELPGPSHLTLLLKHAKSTTLISVLPSDTLLSTKALLLSILRSRNLTTLPGSSTALPSKPSDLEFAILVDRKDPAKGWVYAEDWRSVGKVASKSSKKGTKGKKNEGEVETWEELDLKDGSWIAYRVKTNALDLVDDAAVAEDMQLDEDEQEAPLPGAGGEWDVVFPRYDDDEDLLATDGEPSGADDDLDDIPIPVPRNAVAD